MPRKRIVRRRRVRRNPTVSSNPRARRTIRVRSKRGRRHVAALERMGKSRGTAIRMAAAAAKRGKRRKTRTVKHTVRSHASYVKDGKKAARTRARHATSSVASRRRRRTRKVTHRGTFGRRVMLRVGPRTKRRAKFQGRRSITNYKGKSGRRHPRYHYSYHRVRRNPLSAMKTMIMDGASLYGGYVGSKIIGGLLQQYVLSNASIAPTIAKLGTAAQMIPSALTFVLAAFAGKLLPNQPKVVSAIQTGATLNLLISAVRAFVVPNLGTSLPAFMTGALSGIDDMGFRGFGGYHGYGQIGEYVQQRPGLGAYVSEAMALDEYVQDGGGMHGFDVQEALADSEVQGMQSGFAAGSLARTTFAV